MIYFVCWAHGISVVNNPIIAKACFKQVKNDGMRPVFLLVFDGSEFRVMDCSVVLDPGVMAGAV